VLGTQDFLNSINLLFKVSDQLMEANCPLDLAYTLVDER
jgi:hypothetical protein